MPELLHAPKQAPLRKGATTVVKVGGRVLEDAAARARLAHALARAIHEGARVVVVHGGGAQVSRALADRGIEARFVGGLRVTTAEALDVAEPVLTALGKRLAHDLTLAGAPAVGLSGRDGHVLTACVKDPALGRVGTPEHVDGGMLRFLAFNGITPVLGPLAAAQDGGLLNVNADEAAAHVARALGAHALVLLTDVDAVRDGGGAALPELTAAAARDLIATGAAHGGMVPKLEAALHAVDGGVRHVHVLSGQDPAALEALLAGEAVGTLLKGVA